jgi:hypothetical protein
VPGRTEPKRAVAATAVSLGLVLLASPGSATSAQTPTTQSLDTVVATGSTPSFAAIDIRAESGPGGENASGHMTFLLVATELASGPVTCLSVTGNDAVLNAQTAFGVVTVELVDNGGNGKDTMSAIGGRRAASDCSPFHTASLTETLTSGRAVIFDAPLLPTSKAQCTSGGWRNYPRFNNQGQCVAFVVKQARQSCVAERAKIGLLAFRNKYGLGPYHVRVLRRCVKRQAGRR